MDKTRQERYNMIYGNTARKIEDNVQNPTYITTVWGYGYKWGA